MIKCLKCDKQLSAWQCRTQRLAAGLKARLGHRARQWKRQRGRESGSGRDSNSNSGLATHYDMVFIYADCANCAPWFVTVFAVIIAVVVVVIVVVVGTSASWLWPRDKRKRAKVDAKMQKPNENKNTRSQHATKDQNIPQRKVSVNKTKECKNCSTAELEVGGENMKNVLNCRAAHFSPPTSSMGYKN